MKTKKIIILLMAVLFSFSFQQCTKDEEPKPEDKSILPERFKVDIPDAISSNTSYKCTNIDAIDGNLVYEHLTNFIHVGEASADLFEEIIMAIAVNGINKPMSFSFVGDDDNRTKNLVVIDNVTFNGVSYNYQLTITDAESESNADGGNALQVFWSNEPIRGIAILKPYNIDRTNDDNLGNAIYMIEYSEAGEYGYDAHMIVSIVDLPLEDPSVEPYSINTLKMFAGKKGDIIDVYGNTNHPNAHFFNDDAENIGFNWAFVASGDESADIGVAEVGLPPSNLDETNRSVLLEDYSIENVFTRLIYEEWPTIDSTSVAEYLQNTEAPGYFNSSGFVCGGTSPGSEYDVIELRIKDLTPYNPYDITNLEINFND
ncbi:MAG: hypothetical protein KAT68_06740 [Bacteroidales bacterium]|nr:hypothetical protein [Bacteroidales bacterium]